MRLERLRSLHMEQAVQLYLLGEDWTPWSHLGVTEQDAIAALSMPNSTWRLAITEDNKIAGLIGFENINMIDRTAEPYISMYPNMRGPNTSLVAEEALEWAKSLQLRRVKTTILYDAPSLRVLHYMGFKHEGTHEQARYRNGMYVDTHTYSLLIEED